MRAYLTAITLIILVSASAQRSGDLIGVPSSAKLKGNSKKMLKKGYKFYEVESGRITYKLIGQDKTNQWYFDRYGLREVRIESSLDGQGSMYIRDGELDIKINLADTTAFPPTMKTLYTSVSERMENEYQKAKKLESKEIANQSCEVYLKEYPRGISFKDHVWTGIVLKLEMTQKDETIGYEAEEITLEHVLDEKYFKILKHVQLVYPENN